MKHNEKRLVHLFIIAALIAVAFVAIAPTALAAPPGSPFTGAWKSTDIDGSHQKLAISNGSASGTYRLNLYDDGASVCIPLTGAMVPASVRGTGTASGNVLTATLIVTCLSHPPISFGPVSQTFTYDPGTDTLTDGVGVTWFRQGSR